jgi:hypothetical protein
MALKLVFVLLQHHKIIGMKGNKKSFFAAFSEEAQKKECG